MKIAISGKAKSGKDTLAGLLITENSKLQSYGSADRIKTAVKIMFPQMKDINLWGESSLREELIPETNISYRQTLLDLGKLGRSYDPDFWIKSTFNSLSNKNDIIIKDLRFINEYNFLKQENFFLVRIKRKDHSIVNDVSDTEQDSLTDDMFDFIIENDKDFVYLCDQAKLLLRTYETRQKLLSNSF